MRIKEVLDKTTNDDICIFSVISYRYITLRVRLILEV
jgi:hypothetical protein